jgi:uncharacterized protein YecT (DUF1311 family)
MNIQALLILLVFAFTAAIAQEPEEACSGTTYDQSVCLSAKHKRTDAELNASYQKALKSAHYGEKDVQNLKDAQRKWIVYRDAACEAEYYLWGGGSGGPNAHIMCLIELTKERTTHLKVAYRFFSN